MFVVEKQPEFPGGEKELFKFLAQNFKYPAEAQKQKIQGRVVTQFVVEADGSLSEIKAAEGANPYLAAEAVRIISKMPKWTPGMQKDKSVRTRYTIPVLFRLEGALTQPKADNASVVVTAYYQLFLLNPSEKKWRI